jgi:hypothetical protein
MLRSVLAVLLADWRLHTHACTQLAVRVQLQARRGRQRPHGAGWPAGRRLRCDR